MTNICARGILRDKRNWLPLVAVIAAIAIGGIIGSEGRVGIFAVIGAFAASLAFVGRPYQVLAALTVCAFSADYLHFTFGFPFDPSYAELGLIVLLFFLAAPPREDGDSERSLPAGYVVALMALLLAIFFSYVMNSTSLDVVAAGLKNYLQYVILFWAVARLKFSVHEQGKIQWLILVLIVLQLPIVVLQRYGYLPGAAAYGSSVDDVVGGTLGVNSTGVLTLLCLGVTSTALSNAVYEKLRARYLIIATIGVVPPLFAEGKLVLFLLPVIVVLLALLQFLLRSNGSVRRAMAVLAIGVGLSICAANLMPVLSPTTELAQIIASPDALWMALNTVGGDPVLAKLGRVSDVTISFQLLMGSPGTFLFGFGPGLLANAGKSLSMYSPFAYYLNKGIGSSQLSEMLLEVGFLGSAAYFLLLFCIALPIFWAAVKSRSTPGLRQSTSFLFLAFLYIVGTVYAMPWWSAALSIPFWTLAGFAWANSKVRSQANEGARSAAAERPGCCDTTRSEHRYG